MKDAAGTQARRCVRSDVVCLLLCVLLPRRTRRRGGGPCCDTLRACARATCFHHWILASAAVTALVRQQCFNKLMLLDIARASVVVSSCWYCRTHLRRAELSRVCGHKLCANCRVRSAASGFLMKGQGKSKGGRGGGSVSLYHRRCHFPRARSILACNPLSLVALFSVSG